MIYTSHSEKDTFKFSYEFGKKLKKGSIVCLFGNLGAGKTTFMKGLVEGAASYPFEKISSPTFVYLNIYEGDLPIYHFDLYRLNNAEEFIAAGFEDFLYMDGICCIEWAQKIEEILPPHISIYISSIDENSREIKIDDETFI